jgi:ubiquinone biosynthesis protein
MEELSGAFIKLGQLLSLRPDLIPKEYCDEFSKLQDDVAPFNFIYVKRIIEDELKKPLGKIFSSFDKTPIASASIGQVHKAKLISGEVVAVKVQRPRIEDIFSTDIDLLHHLAHLAEKNIPELKQYDVNSIVKEFEEYTKKELNYVLEAKNIEEFYNNFKQNSMIKIPKVFWDYTSKRVLTMEFIEGEKLKEVKSLSESRREKIAELIIKSMIKQIMEDKIFHADPHPGNILLLEKDKLALLDFGIVGRLNDDIIEKTENIILGLIKPDKDILTRALMDLGFVKEGINVEEFKEDLSQHLGHYYNVDEQKIDISSALYDIIAISKKYEIKFPTSFVLLAKATATLEGLVRDLKVEFNVVQALKPYAEKIVKKRISTKYQVDKIRKFADDVAYTLKDLPGDVKEAVKKIKQGELKLNVNNADISRFALEIDRSSNRITFGLIVAAALVSAALVMLANMPPFYMGIPVLGLIFFVLAVLFAFALLISIIKEKSRGENEKDY